MEIVKNRNYFIMFENTNLRLNDKLVPNSIDMSRQASKTHQ
jgi:hypothetical protein